MQLGFVSAILPDFTLEDVLRFTQEAGLDCVELMCWPQGKAERRYAGVTHVDVEAFTADDAGRLRERAAAHQVGISGLGYYPNPLSPDRAEAEVATEHLRKVIGASALLGVKIVNTFVGRDWTRSIDDNWPRFLETWRPLVHFAEEHDVRIAIENCPMYFTRDEWPGGKNLATSPAIWRRMFDDIPSRHFGLNYDPSHLVWQQMDIFEPLRQFADRLFHLHAKDVAIDRQRLNQVGIMAHPNDYHRPKLPGLGEIDWGQFVSVLHDVGYQGAVCIEVEDRAYEKSSQSRQAAVLQSGAYLRNFLRRT